MHLAQARCQLQLKVQGSQPLVRARSVLCVWGEVKYRTPGLLCRYKYMIYGRVPLAWRYLSHGVDARHCRANIVQKGYRDATPRELDSFALFICNVKLHAEVCRMGGGVRVRRGQGLTDNAITADSGDTRYHVSGVRHWVCDAAAAASARAAGVASYPLDLHHRPHPP